MSKWMKLNKLSINTNKTNLIVLRSKRNNIKSDISITLDNHKLIPVDNIKCLGMYLDTHLSWDVHIKQLSITLDNHKLIPVDNIKYLGMYLDTHLSWDVHIKQLSIKLDNHKLIPVDNIKCLGMYTSRQYQIFRNVPRYPSILGCTYKATKSKT